MLTLGSSVFIAQFAFIMSGTFVYHSWDVMEPIAYVMMLGNFTGGLAFYATFKREMQLTTLHEMLAKRFAHGLYRKAGLDIERLKRLESEIIELRGVLNTSIY